MRKIIAIGDVHAEFDLMWDALRAASCVNQDLTPTAPVRAGHYQVIFIGDLVHPKSEQAYERLTELKRFDTDNEEHLLLAANKQIEELEKIKTYHEVASHSIHFLLGNHDDAVINASYVLGTSGGLTHVEFDPEHGGVIFPKHLSDWMSQFPRDLRLGSVQFTHVSPLPAHQYYDDLFYNDHSTKKWFKETPEYIDMAGLRFGVYGHTQIKNGILIHKDEEDQPRFAMIDALQERQYLELLYDERKPDPLQSVRAVSF